MKHSERYSEILFKDLANSPIGGFVKVVWNGRTIFEDTDDGPQFDGEAIVITEDKPKFSDYWVAWCSKYENKQVYSFYCSIVDFHHTVLYIEGELV